MNPTDPKPEDSASRAAASGCPATTCSPLSLEEFVFEQLKSLEDFESSWRELHRENDETYPLEMLAGDWVEQLALFRERED